ncbi:MAG: methyltransferase MtaB domain-containing protein, partial [Rhodothermales bacterium]|nr:methyltransferase MtaB domain-containing protein [Rhodothermales bacterium]
LVFPEVNFTLPQMVVDISQMSAILSQYREMVDGVLSRLVALRSPGVVIEFEHAPQMTADVEIGTSVTAQTKNLMRRYYEKHGLKSALRVTVCDIREQERPPRMRTGEGWRKVLAAFEESAQQGADLLSIESTGGKEVSDQALLEGDIEGLLLALGILAPRDARALWRHVVDLCADGSSVAAGDTACAFANTAMVLADKRYIPNVLAAVVRAMASVRTLVAHEEGAVGPTKDCAYEGPVVKAITGCPISLEGKSAACAHFSHVGNVAMAVCDLWSNESVQNVRLLSGFAPEVFAEILEYDCRLINTATAAGEGGTLRRLLVDSDVDKSVHALIIAPSASVSIAEAIVSESSDYLRVRAAGLAACQLIRDALSDGLLEIEDRETPWLERIEESLTAQDDESQLLDRMADRYSGRFLPAEYGL